MSQAPQTLTSEHFAFPAIVTRIERTDAPQARFSLLDDMFVERGTKADWELLHDLHYKAENLAVGPRFYRLDLYGKTIGVLVTSNPKGLLKERHLLFPGLKIEGADTKIVNIARYKAVNNDFRVVSRFVIDTMFRGIGAGYRMMNLVSRMEGNRFMEIQSSMSKFNLFGQKAGFRFVKPMNSTKFVDGIRFFRQNFASNPQDFEALIAEAEARPPAEQARLMERCKDFYLKNSTLEKTGRNRQYGAKRVEALTMRGVIKNVQQLVLASPMYGVWKNPEHKVEVPQKLPLLAFGWQDPNAPLDRGRL